MGSGPSVAPSFVSVAGTDVLYWAYLESTFSGAKFVSAYLSVNAWREMLARIFDKNEVELNVSPEWLINPATRRRLKLDYLYPELGIAVRFGGLAAKGQRRKSDWEALEDDQRDQTRVELCRLNGVQLAVISPAQEPDKEMERLLRVLSRASRLKAESDLGRRPKKKAMDALSKALNQANRLHTSLRKQPDQTIATLAEAWRDREAGLAVDLQQASEDKKRKSSKRANTALLKKIESGLRVVHSRFGDGVVTEVDGEGSEMRITIFFDGDRERTFLANLVLDKLKPLKS